MTLEDNKTIGIVGAGQMGRGISQVCATAGYQVLLVDVAEMRGIFVERLGGTRHNDIFKKYIARKNGSSHLTPHCGSSPTLSPTVRNRLLYGIRSASVGRGLNLSKAVEPREVCGVAGR
jgi:D-arabinose 1-dehydrogenase-like Zn-dependent alcohol dehydrogenase